MATNDSSLYYTQGVIAALGKNYNKARQHLNYAARTSGDQADIYRALALVDTMDTSSAQPQNILNVYNYLRTYGELESITESGRETGLSDTQFPFARYSDDNFDLLNINFMMTSESRWVAAAAAVSASQGQHELAHSILRDGYDIARKIPGEHQILDVVNCLNLAAAGQWGMVLDVSESWQDINDWDDFSDEIGSRKNIIHAIFTVLRGEAFAHLDNITSAQPLLNTAADSMSVAVRSHALYILGLIERKEHREEEAQKALSVAQSVNPRNSLARKALEDNSEVLYITSRENIGKRTDFWDKTTEPSISAERQAARDAHRQEIIDKALKKLDDLIGMSSVKTQVRSIKERVEFNELKKARGIASDATMGINMVFQGPPGTGKTTVARLLGDIFFGLGVLERPDVTEVTSSALVAGFVGQTAKQANDKFQEARGGVFFLDEAYSLVQNSGGGNGPDFGKEALDELLPLIYNHRDDTCTIIAGYPQDMERFMDVNEGLRSRFNFYVTFDSYTAEELGDIAEFSAKKYGNTLAPAAREALVEAIRPLEGAQHSNGKNLIDVMGNARFADNIIEASANYLQARLMKSGDVASLSDEAFTTIETPDILQAFEEVTSRFIR